jgi:hypothetical protein
VSIFFALLPPPPRTHRSSAPASSSDDEGSVGEPSILWHHAVAYWLERCVAEISRARDIAQSAAPLDPWGSVREDWEEGRCVVSPVCHASPATPCVGSAFLAGDVTTVGVLLLLSSAFPCVRENTTLAGPSGHRLCTSV